jgi:hypothetical protein
MRGVALLLLACFAFHALASVDVRLPVRRRMDAIGAPSVLVYGGRPPRQYSVQLVLGAPPPEFAPGTLVTPTRNDLPGAYPALQLSATHPLARGNLLVDIVVGLNPDSAVSTPRVDLTAGGRDFSLSVLVGAPGQGLPAVLHLGPGSAAWLQWRTAVLTRDYLYLLRDEDGPAALRKVLGRDNARTHEFPCDFWDALGRCMLGNQTLRSARMTTTAARLVLDFGRATSTLPAAWMTQVRHAAPLTWSPRGSRPLTLVSDANDITVVVDIGLGSPDDPLAAPGNMTLVLGRSALERHFTALAFDSALNVFAAAVTTEVPAPVRIVLAVCVVLEVVLFARFFVSVLVMRLPAVLEAIGGGGQRPYVPAMDTTAALFMALSTVVGLVGASIGYTWSGSGDGSVDPVTVAGLEWATLSALIVTASEALVLALIAGPVLLPTAAWRIWSRRGQSLTVPAPAAAAAAPAPAPAAAKRTVRNPRWLPLLDLIMATCHATCSGCALVATLNVAAAHHVGSFFVLWIMSLVLVLPPLVYNGTALCLACIAASWMPAADPVFVMGCVLGALHLALAGLAGYGIVQWVAGPFWVVTNVVYDPDQVRASAAVFVAMIAFGTVAFVTAETRRALDTVSAARRKKET